MARHCIEFHLNLEAEDALKRAILSNFFAWSLRMPDNSNSTPDGDSEVEELDSAILKHVQLGGRHLEFKFALAQ